MDQQDMIDMALAQTLLSVRDHRMSSIARAVRPSHRRNFAPPQNICAHSCFAAHVPNF